MKAKLYFLGLLCVCIIGCGENSKTVEEALSTNTELKT